MTTYKPGTVAVATVRGVEDVRVMAGYGTAEPRLRWMTTDARLMDEHNEGWFMAYHVTDIRPLMVLDWHPNQTHVGELLNLLRANYWTSLADQIEAQVKPPRIPEPGPWGVVKARGACSPLDRKWVRYGTGWRDAFGNHVGWDDLDNPTLIRDGIQ